MIVAVAEEVVSGIDNVGDDHLLIGEGYIRFVIETMKEGGYYR